MKTSDITVEGFEAFTEENWFMYAMATHPPKKFLARPGKKEFRVMNGDELVCETDSLQKAIDTYNSITSKPIDQPKTDN